MSAPGTDHEPWVQLKSGAALDLLTLTVEQARAAVPDLISSICVLPRFNGHTKHATWSVGSHSLLVADLLEEWGATPQICRVGLLHDIGEAIYGDVTSPVIRAMRTLFEETIKKARLSPGYEEEVLFFGDPFTRLRASVDPVLAAALGLEGDAASKELVKRADLVALALERRDLMARGERDWNLPEFAPPGRKIYWSEYGLDAGQVERAFFERLERLNEAIEIAKQPAPPPESPVGPATEAGAPKVRDEDLRALKNDVPEALRGLNSQSEAQERLAYLVTLAVEVANQPFPPGTVYWFKAIRERMAQAAQAWELEVAEAREESREMLAIAHDRVAQLEQTVERLSVDLDEARQNAQAASERHAIESGEQRQTIAALAAQLVREMRRGGA